MVKETKKTTVEVEIVHPFDGSRISLEIDIDVKAKEIIQELIRMEYIQQYQERYYSERYYLAKNKNDVIEDIQTLEEVGVKDGSVLHVVPRRW